MRPVERYPCCALGGEVQEPVTHPLRDVAERLRIAAEQPLALDPLVEVEDVDVQRPALVAGAGDFPGQLLLAW